jgi:hypothetical protein
VRNSGNIVASSFEDGLTSLAEILVELELHVLTGSSGTETYRSRDISEP